MNKPILYILKVAILSFILIGLNACTKELNITDLKGKGKEINVTVNVNFTYFSDEIEISNKKASINDHASNSLIDTTINLNDKFLLKAEMTTDYDSRTNINQITTRQNGIIASTSPVDNNIWYRLVAFNKTTGDYITERLYQRGNETNTNITPELTLNTSIEYTFVAYSVNSTNPSSLPLIGGPSSGKTLTNTYIDISSGNADILFTKIDKNLTVQGPNYLNLVFKRKSSQVALTIDATATGNNIEIVTSKVTPRNTQVRLNFLNESLTRTSNNEDIPLLFPNLGTAMIATSTPVVVNSGAITGNNYLLTISTLKIGAISINTNILAFNNVNFTPGSNYILKLTVTPNDEFISNYGGYGVDVVRINGQVWMRHNLRTDGIYSATPDIPGPAIFGHYYQWGRIEPISLNPFLLSNHQNWTTVTNTNAHSWNANPSNDVNIRELTPSKANQNNSPNTFGNTGDPCPPGFRVPSHKELEKLFNTSSVSTSFIGNLTASSTNNNGAAVLTSLRNANIKLTFPTQGTFFSIVGNNQSAGIDNKGSRARTWTSYHNITTSYVTSHANIWPLPSLMLSVSYRTASSNNTSIALPIRCIAINSNIP